MGSNNRFNNNRFEEVTLTRDCNALLIPAGVPVVLLRGSKVVITQAMGGSFTVNDQGRLLRVAGVDGDALGKEALTAVDAGAGGEAGGSVDLDQVWEQLKTCYDPEIPVNIVDLGLIYKVACDELADGRQQVCVTMTLTAPGCGMGTVLAEDVRQKALAVPHVDAVEVELVTDPPWDQGMMSDAAKLKLGLL